LTYLIIRNKPEDIGTQAFGASSSLINEKSEIKAADALIYKNFKTYYFGIIYALFGFTYSVYVTFVITFAVKELYYTEYSAGNFWIFIGFLSLLSGPVFGGISDKFGRKYGFISVFTLQTVSYIALVLSISPNMRWIFHLSVVLFGLTAWSIPSIMTATVSDNYSANQMSAAFGFITFIFGLGQIAGPTIAGRLAEYCGSFKYSFIMISLVTLTAAVLSGFYHKTKKI